MSLNRSAARFTPLLRGPPRLRRPAHSFPRTLPAVAILLPRRGLATETSTSTGPTGNFPPPGFNTEQAKKPIQSAQQSGKQEKSSSKAQSAKDKVSKEIIDDIQLPRDAPTAASKTAATEARTLAEFAAEKASADKVDEKKVSAKKEEERKLTIWEKVKKEVHHYWDGTKLLAMEVRISSKLALKMAAGYELTRRENRQLQRTVQDLGRLVPFSVFVIVPFAELLLPIALKLFPNMLPSTYEGKSAKDAKAAHLRATRKEVSSFLRQTLRETGLPVTATSAQKEDFQEFFRKVRSTGESPTKADVIKVCKVFKDDLTLDNLSRPQLVGICRYMNLNSMGPDTILRYQIRHRMRQIKRDDKAIAFEGISSLSVTELQTAAASRGLRTHGVSPGRLRDDLQMWLDLRLKYGVPSTLLVLSNAFMYATGQEAEFNTQIDALKAVLSSIPEELFHEIELEVHTLEGAATNKQRLEVLKEQQELIEEENQQSEISKAASSPKDDTNIDEKEEQNNTNNSQKEKEIDTEKETRNNEELQKADPKKA